MLQILTQGYRFILVYLLVKVYYMLNRDRFMVY